MSASERGLPSSELMSSLPYLVDHQKRVQKIARAIGESLGMRGEKLHVLGLGAAYCDIGMTRLPPEMLLQPGPLMSEERGLVRRHPEIGHEILHGVALDPVIAEVALQHHERISGTGYPRGLVGSRIIFEAKIIAVADVLAAMTADRPHRAAPGLDAALDEIQSNEGILYDSEVVRACVTALKEHKIDLQ